MWRQPRRQRRSSSIWTKSSATGSWCRSLPERRPVKRTAPGAARAISAAACPTGSSSRTPTRRRSRREAEGGLGKAPMTTLTLRMIKGDFIVTGPDVEPSNASPAARPETGAPSTIRHRRLKRSAAAVSGKRGSGLPIADARAGGKARDGEFA